MNKCVKHFRLLDSQYTQTSVEGGGGINPLGIVSFTYGMMLKLALEILLDNRG